MAQKQSILGRIGQLTRANINALLDKAEDPEKMLDQLVRDYTNSIAEAEDAVAQTIGNLRLAEADHAEDVAAVKEWGSKALAASQKADALRASGQAGRGRQVRPARQDRPVEADRLRDRGQAGRAHDRRRRTRPSRSSRPA